MLFSQRLKKNYDIFPLRKQKKKKLVRNSGAIRDQFTIKYLAFSTYE